MIRSHCQSIDSTNAEARRTALRFPGKRVLVSATTQTAGRGRHGRAWTSPEGGAWFTLGYPYHGGPDAMRAAPLLAGLAVINCLESALGSGSVGLSIKWPNDVLLDGRKVAGVLCERILPHAANSGTVLIGIGINLNLRPDQLPRQMRFPATSVLATTGKALDISRTIERCVQRFLQFMDELEGGLLKQAHLHDIEQRLAWRHQAVQMTVGDGQVAGMLLGIDHSGRLRLLAAGAERAYDGGEITELRPTGAAGPRNERIAG